MQVVLVGGLRKKREGFFAPVNDWGGFLGLANGSQWKGMAHRSPFL